MPEYLSPGVYVEEVATGPRPIEGVSTSTAGFVGVTERGALQPRLVTSWPQYQRYYGGYLDRGLSFLPFAIQAFFENGGQRAFIARVARADAVAATFDLAPAPGGAGAAATSLLRLTAAGPGAWGNNILARIRTATLADPNTATTRDLFRVSLIYYADGIPSPLLDPTVSANLASPFFEDATAIEDYDNCSIDPLSADYVITVINARSQLVTASYVNTAAGQPAVPVRPADRGFGQIATLALNTATPGLDLVFDAAGPGGWGNGITVELVPGTNPGTSQINVVGAGRNESFDNIVATSVLPTLNAGSKLVRARWSVPPAPAALPPATGPTPLASGLDTPFQNGIDAPAGQPTQVTAQNYIGNLGVRPDRRTGLAALESIDDISIVCVPDEVRGAFAGQVTNAMVDQCERLRYRFAVLSVDEATENAGDVNAVNPPRDSSYAAIYYPWVRVIDPRTGRDFTVPPSGHVAGIYARTDVERGVHKAPANEVVRAIVTRDLGADRKPLDYTLAKQEHDLLNPRGVNVIRDFRSTNRGIRVWGARTMSTDTQWKYINVRRLFIFVEASIDRGTQWVVFEPNDEGTWSSVRRSLTGFLTTVWRNGALFGATADEAFFVKCDRTTMSQDDIDNGRLICLVGIAPVKPAEFVIFRISQKTADAEQA